MGFMDLRQWLGLLEKNGDLRRIGAEVHWDRELGAVARRVLEKMKAIKEAGFDGVDFKQIRRWSHIGQGKVGARSLLVSAVKSG